MNKIKLSIEIEFENWFENEENYPKTKEDWSIFLMNNLINNETCLIGQIVQLDNDVTEQQLININSITLGVDEVCEDL